VNEELICLLDLLVLKMSSEVYVPRQEFCLTMTYRCDVLERI